MSRPATDDLAPLIADSFLALDRFAAAAVAYAARATDAATALRDLADFVERADVDPGLTEIAAVARAHADQVERETAHERDLLLSWAVNTRASW
jgi:hypothetical protein